MSDAEAPAQSSEAAEKTPTTGATVSETTTAQDGTLTGSDEAINGIADIDSYRNMVGSMSPNSAQAEKGEASEETTGTTEGAASGKNADGEGEGTQKGKESDGEGSGTEAEKGKEAKPKEGSETNQGGEGEGGEEEDEGQADAGHKKTPQYRWRPKSEVDALAMDIIKRAEKSGKEISMKDALAQAETILKPDDTGDGSTGAANDFPKTVTESETLLTDLRAQRKQAFAKDLDFEKAAELDEQIEAVKDHIGSLKQAEATTRQDQESRWNQTLETSKTKAVELYPDVTNPESELVKKMVELDATLKESGNDLFYAPDKPLKLAQMAANELGIAPKKPGATTQAKTQAATKPTASSQPAKAAATAATRPVQSASAPMSGAARTTQASSTTGQFDAELDKITDEESYRAHLDKFKSTAAA